MVVEVSGRLVVAAVAVGNGMEATTKPQDIWDRMVGVDLSNIDHQTRVRGESVETTTIMVIAHAVPTASTLMETTQLFLHS